VNAGQKAIDVARSLKTGQHQGAAANAAGVRATKLAYAQQAAPEGIREPVAAYG
jgi:hypothetical protein